MIGDINLDYLEKDKESVAVAIIEEAGSVLDFLFDLTVVTDVKVNRKR